ncbi:unnamed protein product, partial [marine sediment metagenome]
MQLIPTIDRLARSAIYAMNEPTGFVDKTETTLSISTRTVTITPTGTSFTFWQQGKKYVKTGAENTDIADTDGIHAVYYDDGSLTSIVNPSEAQYDELMEDKVIVALVYWNSTDVDAYIFGDERHGCIMSGATHHYLHDTVGAAYQDGLTASGYVVDGTTDADLTFELTDGEFYDEDLEIEIEDGTPANWYEQQLNGGDAEIPILYRSGNPGHWTQDAATDLPYKTGGSGRMAYNSEAAGTWGQTEVTDGKWVSATLVATNDSEYPIKMIQGQSEYATKATAIEDANSEILALGNLPTKEWVVLYRFVMQTKNTYGSTPKAIIRDATDFRGSEISGTAAVASDHGALAGLADDDHSQYVLADG